MHVVWGILPENFVSGMYSSLICCCLLGNVDLNLLSCLSIWTDPLLMVGRLFPANLGGFPPLCPHPCLPSVLHLLPDNPSKSTALILSLSFLLRAFTDTYPPYTHTLPSGWRPAPPWSYLVGHLLPPPRLAPQTHRLLACPCNFPLPPYKYPSIVPLSIFPGPAAAPSLLGSRSVQGKPQPTTVYTCLYHPLLSCSLKPSAKEVLRKHFCSGLSLSVWFSPSGSCPCHIKGCPPSAGSCAGLSPPPRPVQLFVEGGKGCCYSASLTGPAFGVGGRPHSPGFAFICLLG